MIIDFHTHIFPPYIKYRREDFFDDLGFKLLYHNQKSKIVTAEELVNAMDINGVDKSVVFGFPWLKEENYKRHNDYIIESVNRFPERLIGFCCFYPTKNSEKELLRCLRAGLKGVGEIAFYNSDITLSIIDSLKGIMDICKENKLPFLLHTNEPVGHMYAGKSPISLSGLYMFIKTYTENKVVLAHWGGGLFFYNIMKKEVKDILQNVWFDTAASPYLYEKNIYNIALNIVGLNKILFGSDYPLLSPRRYFEEMKKAGLDDVNMNKILGENAIKVLRDV